MSQSLAQLTGRLDQVPKAIIAARRKGLTAAANAGKAQFNTAPGAPHGLVAKRPLRVTTKVTEETATIRWGQSARLVNDPTRPHFIRPRASGSAKNQYRPVMKTGQLKANVRAMAIASFLGAISGAAQTGLGAGIRHALNITGVGPRAFAKHPGTKGKHFVEAGKERARPVITRAYHEAHVSALAEVFRR